MRSRIRVITDHDETFADRLEARARSLTQDSHLEGDSPQRILQQRIALKVGELEALRATRDHQQLSLTRVECYTNTELIQMEARTPRYSPYRYPEREKLQRRLLKLEEERRRMAWTHQEREGRIHEDLLRLLQQHQQASE